MSETVQGGYTANKSGKWLEQTVKNQLMQAGYHELSLDEKRKLIRADGANIFPYDSWFVEQVRLERNLYDSRYTSDFYLFSEDRHPEGLHIECKWQASSGSVDEKYVFTALSLKKFRAPAVLLLAGSGARQGAVSWLRRQNNKRFTFIGSLEEFMLWVQKGCL